MKDPAEAATQKLDQTFVLREQAIRLAPDCVLNLDDEGRVVGRRRPQAARGDVSLTYFEYGTLAALHPTLAGWLSSRPSGRLLKLRRIAERRLADYL